MKKKTRKLLQRAAVAAAVAAALAAIFAASYYKTYYRSNVSEDGFLVKIYHDYDFEALCNAVTESGVLKDSVTFVKAAKALGLAESFKPGLYKLKKGMNNKAIVRAIANGWQTPTDLVIPAYIRSLDRLSSVLGNSLEADSAAFMATFKDRDIIKGYGFNEYTFIGMFIPNTYEVWWTTTPEKLLERMKKEYDAFWTPQRVEKAENMGLTPCEVTTLASIVIEETKYEPEMPTVAGVYINRLRKGMPLQADPTVRFAVGDFSIRRVLKAHLKVDSPYNTYKYTGLPPGPITIPPTSAVNAVLNYEHHDYLYFCANPSFDGRHAFAATLAQHNRNAQAYHRAYAKRKK